jgi:hypothetical protein
VNIQGQLNNKNNIDLTGIKVMSPALLKTLDDFNAAMNIDFSAMITEVICLARLVSLCNHIVESVVYHRRSKFKMAHFVTI